ncbi:MAG: hypothetical protein NUV65_00795 [Candidatus Roizmanbacteria bacterium]|nr:hypothetical protein [Candidatus Roizmanbacteria bacterium]
MKLEQGTIYKNQMFGFAKIEAKNISIDYVKHAQYDRALRVTFTEKNKRKPERFIEGYNPQVVVLSGFQAFDPPSPMESHADGSWRTKYGSYDPQYKIDFDLELKKFLEETNQTAFFNSSEMLRQGGS